MPNSTELTRCAKFSEQKVYPSICDPFKDIIHKIANVRGVWLGGVRGQSFHKILHFTSVPTLVPIKKKTLTYKFI